MYSLPLMPQSFEQRMEHLAQAMAKVIREVVEFPPGVFVTVLGAKMTRNQLKAKIILSVLPTPKKDEAVEALKEYDHDIKDALAHELRLRKIPDFYWSFDDTEAEAAAIEETLFELKQKGEL